MFIISLGIEECLITLSKIYIVLLIIDKKNKPITVMTYLYIIFIIYYNKYYMDNNKLLLEKVTLKYSVIVAEGKKDSQQVNMEYKTNKIKASLNNVKNIITDFKKDSNISHIKNIVICCDKCEKNVKININKKKAKKLINN